MPSGIFNELIDEQTAIFKNAFSNVSKTLFYDKEQKKLIHAGEFGTYREAVVHDFLRFFTPLNYNISTGFIINSNDEISTQCDIIVYDPEVTPLLQTGNRQRFFPIEPIVGVGEIKSTMTNDQLTEALRKLSEIKKMRDFTEGANIHRRKSLFGSTRFDQNMFPNDQILTFLI